MGDPRRLRKKWHKPRVVWDSDRILEEKKLIKEYSLKNMREVWKAQSMLRNFRAIARKLLVSTGEQAEREKDQLFSKLERLRIIEDKTKVTLDDVLGLNVRQILDRRLQTIVWKKGLARSPRQARQLIVHGHIALNGRRIRSPSHLVTKSEEPAISFYKNPIGIQQPMVTEGEQDGQ